MTLITILPHTPFKKKNILTFFIGTVISMGKGKKANFLTNLYASKEICLFPLSHGNDCTYQKSKDIFFLKGGMGKKSY